MSKGASSHDLSEACVVVVAHPPERRRGRASVPAQAGHCCCCCCCLHSVGGILGAAVAPNLGRGEGPRFNLPLTHYWDEEEYNPGPAATSARDREGITAEVPSPPVRPAASLPPYEGVRQLFRPVVGPSAVSLFWWTFVALAMGGIVLGVAAGDRGSGWLCAGVIFLPGLQLGAAVITALILGLSPRPDKGYQFRQLGKIVLGVVVGTGLGLLVMWGALVLMTRRF